MPPPIIDPFFAPILPNLDRTERIANALALLQNNPSVMDGTLAVRPLPISTSQSSPPTILQFWANENDGSS